ncbi:MAG TPA: HAD-IB family hydrolase [Aldersonia sp.]
MSDLRLPGSVAEVEASPPGPEIGAFFDLDGTIVAGYTVTAMTQERIRRGEIGFGEIGTLLQGLVAYSLGRLEFDEMIRASVAALRGREMSDLDELGERLFEQKTSKLVYPETRELVRAHLDRGHTVVLSSSATSIQVDPVARYVGIDDVLCNRFDVDEDGLLTGHVHEPILWGPGKADAVQKFAAEHDVDLSRSYFYADGDEDVALMYLVGNPRPTNPGSRLTAVANKRGWPILRFSSRGQDSRIANLRLLAGLATGVPIVAGAIGLGLLSRSKRRGVNLLTSTWPGLMLYTNGVSLNVIGEENLDKARPAVFIFNHRNMVDAIIVGALVKENYTGVAKKELESDPIAGNVGKLMDVAFIDRSDRESAVEALKGIEELAAKGISIVIAPEGTRNDKPNEVGRFKKGAFRIAMSAGIPIVPVVIRNADIVAARDSATMNPGTVDVVVKPPISVADWTLDNLDEKIAEVRQIFLDALANWPKK